MSVLTPKADTLAAVGKGPLLTQSGNRRLVEKTLLTVAFRPSPPQNGPSKVRKWEMSVYKLFHTIAKVGVRVLAQNPELRAKTVNFVKDQVVPQAKAGWEKAKPRLEQAKNTAVEAAKDVADMARENDPREDPKKFLSEASQRLRDRAKR